MEKAFIFAGQGSQYVGMGKDLYESYAVAKEYFDEADKQIPNFKKVCFEGPEEELKLTKYTQPGIYVVSAILNRLLVEEKNIAPDVVYAGIQEIVICWNRNAKIEGLNIST